VYALTDRLSVDVSVPYFSSTGGVHQGTALLHAYHEVHAAGVGDVVFGGNLLLIRRANRGPVWASVGLAVKAPSGSDSATALNYNFNPPVERPIDEAFQGGAGGWALIMKGQGVAEIGRGFAGYADGYYGMSLTEHSKVVQNGAFRAVPDTYAARAGVSWLLPRARGFALSAGGRVFGITTRDLIAGGNLYFRRPGYEAYIEPGVSWSSSRHAVMFSLPVRIAQNKRDSLLDISRGTHEGADFARFLIIASYARRF
jgi:hypothetical protein